MKNIIITSLLALAACAPSTEDFAFDRHGDSRNDATPLYQGQSAQGALQTGSDQDYFVAPEAGPSAFVRWRVTTSEEPATITTWAEDEGGAHFFGTKTILPGETYLEYVNLGVDTLRTGILVWSQYNDEGAEYTVRLEQVVGQ